MFGMISIIILWIMKYVLPYFLPFAVALITVVPLHASFIRKGRADKKGRGIMAGGHCVHSAACYCPCVCWSWNFHDEQGADSDRQSWRVEQACGDFVQSCCGRIENYMGLKDGILLYLAGKRFYDITKAMGVQSDSAGYKDNSVCNWHWQIMYFSAGQFYMRCIICKRN